MLANAFKAARLTRNMADRTDGDNLIHITMLTIGRGTCLLMKAIGFQLLGVALTAALMLAPGYLFAQGCPPGSVQPPSGMVAWWPLNETGGVAVSDQSGLGNNGTASGPIGSGSNPKSVAGFVGNGLNFFFGSRVNVPSNSSLDFGTNTSFTIDAWVKGQPSPIVSNFDITTKIGYSVVFDGNNVLRFEVGDPSVTWFGPPITREAWTFVAIVVDRPQKKVTLYTGAPGPPVTPLTSTSPSPVISAALSMGGGLPIHIGGCPGNPNGCDTVIDEVEIFNRALLKSELQSIFNAGSAGKCIVQKKGMTWIHTASNAQTGTITVGCNSAGPNPCDPVHGDTLCTQSLPLLCIYKPAPPASPFQVPTGLNNSDQNNLWSGGVVATTQPHAGTFGHISATPGTDANSYCVAQFGPGWRVAEFHDGWGWNFQAYGGTVSAPAVPSTRFWVHINDQPAANCWATP
jgi:hypothetical protein